jgi:AcrR family transcriptional regulator
MPRARKSSATTSPGALQQGGKGSPTGAAPKTRLIEAALQLAAQKGWRHLGMGEIAREAGVPLGEAYAHFHAKPCLLAGFVRGIDEQVLSGAELEGVSRDRLFGLLMRRFDALKPHRTALKAIMRDSIGEPSALIGLPLMLNSMAWTLEGAGISAEGWRGRARVLALAGAYGAAFRAFLTDDTDDLSRTMAVLDRRLQIRPFGRGEAAPAPSAA